MHLANLTTAIIKKTALFIVVSFIYTFASAQENSPYSRYGMGDLVPSQNIVSRSMGGITAGFIDSSGFLPYSQSINLSNPASLGSLNSTIFDIGGEIDTRTLKSNTSPEKYKATNTLISYLQFGFPITPKKMLAKGNYWGIAFGLRPVTRINYKISADKRLAGIDSVNTLFEGTGGISQANFSTGIKIKNFSFGASTGYSFGNRQNSTKLGFINDSIGNLYMQSNTQSDSRFGALFLTLGAQYGIRLKSNNVLRLGIFTNLQQNLKAKRDNINQTFVYDGNGEIISIDTVTSSKDQRGTITLPATYTAGFTYSTPHWLVGADVEYAAWSKYRYFGATDAVQNNVMVHLGAQYYPGKTTSTKYLNFVKYRAGLYFGNDYVRIGTTNRPIYGVTLGASLPLTAFQRLRLGEFVALNTGVELGQHGNRQNQSLREGIVRFNFGIAMSAAWFQKRKYD